MVSLRVISSSLYSSTYGMQSGTSYIPQSDKTLAMSRNGGNPRVGSLSDWPHRDYDGEPHGFASGGFSKELPSAWLLGSNES